MLLLPLAPGKSTYTAILEQLTHIINESAGLKDDTKGSLAKEEDIEIPKSEFADDLDAADPGSVEVETEKLGIALPKDKTAPYDNNWIEVDESTLAGVTFNDYDIVAFRYGDEQFGVVEAAYEEME